MHTLTIGAAMLNTHNISWKNLLIKKSPLWSSCIIRKNNMIIANFNDNTKDIDIKFSLTNKSNGFLFVLSINDRIYYEHDYSFSVELNIDTNDDIAQFMEFMDKSYDF